MVTLKSTTNLTRAIIDIETMIFKDKTKRLRDLTERWLVYSEILHQIREKKLTHLLQEIEYRFILEDEDINQVFLDVIDRDDDLYLNFFPIKSNLQEFIDMDKKLIFT